MPTGEESRSNLAVPSSTPFLHYWDVSPPTNAARVPPTHKMTRQWVRQLQNNSIGNTTCSYPKWRAQKSLWWEGIRCCCAASAKKSKEWLMIRAIKKPSLFNRAERAGRTSRQASRKCGWRRTDWRANVMIWYSAYQIWSIPLRWEQSK